MTKAAVKEEAVFDQPADLATLANAGAQLPTVAETAKAFVSPGEAIPEAWGDTLTVIRKNWGTAGVPVTGKDYLDTVEFKGGVATNVPRPIAEAWSKKKGLGLYYLPDGVDEEAFVKATGIMPMQPESFAAMLRAYPVDDLVTLLGDQKALEIATALRRALGK